MDNINDIMRGMQERKKWFHIVRSEEESHDTDEIPVVTGQVVQKREILSTPDACPKCHGAGYLRVNVSYGHPQFGKPQKCECKKVQEKEARQRELIADSGIMLLSLYEDASFETFNQDIPGVNIAYSAALGFAQNPRGWLTLVGPYGCGKTHLAVAIARRRIEQGDTALVQTVPDLLDSLRTNFADSGTRFFEMQRVDLLVLDDYGTQNDTDWANEKLFQLLNYRYNGNLPTVITSNDLSGTNPRIHSRMRDKKLARIIEMQNARDYRLLDDEEEL